MAINSPISLHLGLAGIGICLAIGCLTAWMTGHLGDASYPKAVSAASANRCLGFLNESAKLGADAFAFIAIGEPEMLYVRASKFSTLSAGKVDNGLC